MSTLTNDKTISYICRLCKTYEEVRDLGPGAFTFNRVGNIIIHTPDGSVLDWNITIRNLKPYWTYDGNERRPTLTPDLIVCVKTDGVQTDLFHGNLTGGVLRWKV